MLLSEFHLTYNFKIKRQNLLFLSHNLALKWQLSAFSSSLTSYNANIAQKMYLVNVTYVTEIKGAKMW